MKGTAASVHIWCRAVRWHRRLLTTVIRDLAERDVVEAMGAREPTASFPARLVAAVEQGEGAQGAHQENSDP